MGIIKKISDLFRSNLNDLLDKLEDPDKMREQAIVDAEEKYKKAQRLLLSAQTAIKLLEKKQEALIKQITELALQARDYLAQEKEELARSSLKTKQSLEDELEDLRESSSQERQAISTINQGLAALTVQLKNLRIHSSKSTLAKSLSGSRSTTEPQLEPDPLSDTSSFDTFSRMEEKIDIQEAQVEALNELLAESEQADQQQAPEKKKTRTHSPSLEEELEVLKQKLKNNS